MPKAVVIIPARFNSTRFPGKPLALLHQKPLIQHVYEQVIHAKRIEAVFVATDDKKIFDAVTGFGGKAIMTSPGHASGADRVAEAAKDLDSGIIVNVQGDEPFIRPDMVDDVVRILSDDNRASISTLAKRTVDIKEILSPDVVKVVMDDEGFAMYFSRAPIPYYRDEWEIESRVMSQESSDEVKTMKEKFYSQLSTFFCFKHVGIYGFRKDALINFSKMTPGTLERIEKLEQLRALAVGMKIKVKETIYDTFGIDTIEDLKNAEAVFAKNCFEVKNG